jgi:mono/diheme cytochrome c family protein
LAGALVAGAISFSSYSRAQGSREQLLGEMERLINQMQALRDRFLATGPLTAVPVKPAIVRGFIAATVGSKDQTAVTANLGITQPIEDIYLPKITVVLRNAVTSAESPPVITDLSGRFTTGVKEAGRYRVCWKDKSFRSGCFDRIISITPGYNNIGILHLPIPREANAVALYGRVALADGTTARAIDPLANVNVFATVAILDERGRELMETPVNNDDRYLFPVVPVGQRLVFRTRVEKYDHSQGLQLNNPNIPDQRINFPILNKPPKIDPLVALDSSKQRVSNAAAGDQVQLQARVEDPDKDALRFAWQVTGGTLNSATVADPLWKLPSAPGNHAATLIVYDSKGGYARSALNLTVDPRGIAFSGVVSATDTPTLAGAEVDINGRRMVTDSRGFFRVYVPDRKRFVMTIRKSGYAFASNVYYDGVTGGSWRLTKADVFAADPTKAIALQNNRKPTECAGPASARLAWASYPALATPQYQDGHGHVIAPSKDAEQLPGLPSVRPTDRPQQRECGPGVRIVIPPNSLIDANGRAPVGLVTVQLSTVDLATPDQMPGNYSVTQPGDKVGMMQSYGAAVIEITAGATKYERLRSGQFATLILPVDRVQLQAGGALPPAIPLLSYNEARGVWSPDGTARLQLVDGFPAYVAEVTHFTAYNSDLIKTDQSCLAIQNQGMPTSYNLEVTVPMPGAAPVTVSKSGVVGGNAETVLLNLPKETNIVLVPIRTDPGPTQNLPIGVFVVNTGAPQNPAWPTVVGGFVNEPVGPPYFPGACSTKVVLQDLGLEFFPGTPPQGAFLHGLGSFAAVNLTDTGDPAFPDEVALRTDVTLSSQQYRGQIDPTGIRPTLNCYKVVNRMPLKAGETAAGVCPQHAGLGFMPQSALSEVSAVYANSTDLGFGREMHCVQNGANVACYVSNYDSLVYTGPTKAADPAKALKAVDGFNGLVLPDATVAMEYSPIENDAVGDRAVKFYVFAQDGTPLDAANLDGFGARPVPQLCMVCHGGRIPNPGGIFSPSTGGVAAPVFASAADVKLDAKFLPFDLRSFSFAAPDSDALNPFNTANQQTKFRDLNKMVKVAPPPASASTADNIITALYDAWYPGDAVPQQQNAVVPLWNADNVHRNAYNNVVAAACRTCHVANPDPDLRFEQPGAGGVGFEGNLGTVQSRVCKEHVMPHARRTHDLFWTSVSPSQPAQLQAYGDTVHTGGWQVVGTAGVDPNLRCGQEFTPGGGPTSPPTAFTPILTIFSGNCGGCHSTVNHFGGLDLETNTYSHIVNINANTYPSMKRVEFGAVTEANSYLWHKINASAGTLVPLPADPDPMPDGSSGLINTDNAAAITIRDWIRAGAPP